MPKAKATKCPLPNMPRQFVSAEEEEAKKADIEKAADLNQKSLLELRIIKQDKAFEKIKWMKDNGIEITPEFCRELML